MGATEKITAVSAFLLTSWTNCNTDLFWLYTDKPQIQAMFTLSETLRTKEYMQELAPNNNA